MNPILRHSLRSRLSDGENLRYSATEQSSGQRTRRGHSRTGVIVSSGRYVNDLVGFVVPSSVQWLSTAGSRHLTGGFSGYDGEWGSYLGIPLIALLVWT